MVPRTTRGAAVESPALCTKSARGGEAAAARKGSPTLPGVRPGTRGLVLPGAGHPCATFNKKGRRGRTSLGERTLSVRSPRPPATGTRAQSAQKHHQTRLQPAARVPRRPSVPVLHRPGLRSPSAGERGEPLESPRPPTTFEVTNTQAWEKPRATTLDAPRWHPSRTRAAPTGGAVFLSAVLSHLSGHGAGPTGRRADPRRRERLSSRWLR